MILNPKKCSAASTEAAGRGCCARADARRARTVLKSKLMTTERVSPPIVTHGAISTPCTTDLRIPGGSILSDCSDTLYSNAQVQYAGCDTLTHNPVWNTPRAVTSSGPMGHSRVAMPQRRNQKPVADGLRTPRVCPGQESALPMSLRARNPRPRQGLSWL